MLKELRIAGFGGQGVILSAHILGRAAALHDQGYATMTQNYGPEARGGAASAALIVSDEPILYPYLTSPDILVVLSQEAYTRFTPELKENGILLVEEDMVRLENRPQHIRVYGIPATRPGRGDWQEDGVKRRDGRVSVRHHEDCVGGIVPQGGDGFGPRPLPGAQPEALSTKASPTVSRSWSRARWRKRTATKKSHWKR